jgi:4-diphosphocytidyl-2-C-methyl-D-erythritol kinase
MPDTLAPLTPAKTGPDRVEILTPCKLNLFLEVLGKRPDGYHELDMLMEAIDLCDRIVATRGGAGIRLATNVPDIPTDRENIVVRAAELFFEACGMDPSVEFFLEKRIPAGGGLGGGSGNAIGALYALMELFDVRLSPEALFGMACALGSDVPFFLEGGLARCRGRGERIEVLGAGRPRRYVVVVPPFPLRTAQVYASLLFPLTSPRVLGTMSLERAEEGFASGELFFNRLEEPAFKLRPELAELREGALREGVSLQLTGSGSCLFGRAPEGMDRAELEDRLGCRHSKVAVLVASNLPPWRREWRKEGGRGNHRCAGAPVG